MSNNTINQRWARLAEKAQQQRARQRQRQERAKLKTCRQCGAPVDLREWSLGVRCCSASCQRQYSEVCVQRAEKWLREWELKNGYVDPK
jgi:DNA-binding IclR family transcriptional regulator